MLQASNKAAGGETARHQDTRAVSGGTPAAKHNTHRKYKRFLGKYSITSTYQAQANLDQRSAPKDLLSLVSMGSHAVIILNRLFSKY